MLWEVLGIFAVDDKVKISEMVKCALCQHLKLNWPDDCNSHVFTCVSYNGTGKKIWINSHETLLIKTEISEELSVFLEVLGQLNGWLISDF